MKKFIYNMVGCALGFVVLGIAIHYTKSDIKLLFGGLFFLVMPIIALFTGIFTYPFPKEEKTPPQETLRLDHLATDDKVLVISGQHIRRTGTVVALFDDFDWHCGVNFGYANVLLDGGEIPTIEKFHPKRLEVINEK